MLLLVRASTYSRAKIGLPDQCKNMTAGKPNTLPKESNLIKQKYTIQELLPKISRINLSPTLKTKRYKNYREN
jgi:hypothetical protein